LFFKMTYLQSNFSAFCNTCRSASSFFAVVFYPLTNKADFKLKAAFSFFPFFPKTAFTF